MMTEESKNKQIEDLIAHPFARPSSDDKKSLSSDHSLDPLETFNDLPDTQKVQAEKLAQVIDVNDTDAVLNYGSVAQKEISNFSHTVLNKVSAQDTGTIGQALTHLMVQLKSANPSDLTENGQNFFSRLLKKTKQSAYETTAKYQKIGAQVDKIALRLEKEQDDLIKDNHMLEELYDKNLNYYQALNIYIGAGELRMQDIQDEMIPEALKKAEQSGNQMDIQKVNDLSQFLNRLEKRIHDLKVTRQLTIQQAPQIRLIQNTNQQLAEKIQSSINTAIPLWKNQIVIHLTLMRQQDAVHAQQQVSQTTNELLRQNSKILKQSAIDTAKENERAIVDIETLEETQQNLIETLEETLAIQQEGSQRRREAEKRLALMEDDLHAQLLEATQRSQIQGNDH